MARAARSGDEQPTSRRGRLTLRELGTREAQLAWLVAAGRSDADIASHLVLDIADVRVALGELLRRLGLRSRTELALLVAHERADEL